MNFLFILFFINLILCDNNKPHIFKPEKYFRIPKNVNPICGTNTECNSIFFILFRWCKSKYFN